MYSLQTKITQAINVQSLPMLKLENKFSLTKTRYFNCLGVGHVVKIILNPRNVIFVKVNIIFQFVIQKSETQNQMIRETLQKMFLQKVFLNKLQNRKQKILV